MRTWTLATSDTKLQIGVSKDHRLYVLELASPGAKWNWTPVVGLLPLTSERKELRWVFQDAQLDGSDGSRLVLKFRCDDPSLELADEW